MYRFIAAKSCGPRAASGRGFVLPCNNLILHLYRLLSILAGQLGRFAYGRTFQTFSPKSTNREIGTRISCAKSHVHTVSERLSL